MRLSEVQKDALQELGNIGAAHAATTLSQMLNSTVEMSVPKVVAIDIARLSDHIGEDPSAMVAFELQGEIPHGGYVVFYVSRDSAIRITNTMLGMTEMDRALNEMDESALREVGNIMVSAYLDATAELLGFVMLPSPPSLVVDMAHAAMQSLIAQMAEDVDEVLLFRTDLICAEHKIDSDIILMPESSSLKKIVLLLEQMMKPAA
ncbi:MAG: flagellar motor switch protein [Methanoregula sp. PtaU1.Bin051]|nr:MAG: flagellar motor switch protein [Methanoregula sp. PtaU1.Bin051]